VRQAFIKGIGAVVFAFITAGSYIFSLPPQVMQKWWPLIFFGIFVLLAMMAFIDLYKVNLKLTNTQPSITVEPFTDRDILYLKVHNSGAEATFKAQIKISSADPNVWGLKHYTGFWRFSNKGEAKILKDQDDYLKLADIKYSNQGIRTITLSIWFFDESVNYAHSVYASSYWVGATVQREDGSTRPVERHEYDLKVIISSSPELREGAFQETYTLTEGGFKDSSIPLVSHTLGSQPG
jgi:hypothetical protein